MKRYIDIFENFVVNSNGEMEVSTEPQETELHEYELTVRCDSWEVDWNIYKNHIEAYLQRNFPNAQFRDLVVIRANEVDDTDGPSWFESDDQLIMRFAVEDDEFEIRMLQRFIENIAVRNGLRADVQVTIKDVTNEF